MAAESRNPVFLAELPFDPPAVVNTGSIFTKDIAGTTQLFFEDDLGNVFQITSAGAAPIQGGGVAGRVAFFTAANAIGSDADFLWNSGTNTLTVTGAVKVGSTTTYADGSINSGAGAMAIFAGSSLGILTMSAFGGIAFSGSADIQFVTMGGVVQIESTANFALIKGTTASVVGTGGIGLLASQTSDVLLGPASFLVLPSDFAGNPNDDGIDLGSPANRFRTGRFGTSVVIGATTTYADGSITSDSALMLVAASSVTISAVTSVTISGVPLLPDADAALAFGSAAFRWRNGFFSSLISAPLLDMEESGGDPVAVANFGKLYTKDVAGVTELFFQRDDGSVLQLS